MEPRVWGSPELRENNASGLRESANEWLAGIFYFTMSMMSSIFYAL
jgi:hypothetical protein